MQRVETAAVVAHGRPEHAQPAIERLERIAAEAGVTLVGDDVDVKPDVAIVVGGDGTMLRALTRFLGTGVPVVGVNFGRVGFLTAIAPDQLEAGVRRVFAGELQVIELPTLELQVGGETHVAVNDAVITSGTIGRIVELAYEIGGEDLGVQRCDGLVCSTPQGSTAYNLSNGGPVLVWGLDAMVMTFVAPHATHIRPLVVPRDAHLRVENRSPDVPVTVIVDGHPVGTFETGTSVRVQLAEQKALLGTLPEVTFFRRYAATFGR